MTFEQWWNELQELAAALGGAATDREAWRADYDAGKTPRKAWRDEFEGSAGQ